MRLLVAELGDTPLIGFAGAPFTLASYLVEGGPSRNHVKTKAMMYGDPELWHALCDRLAEITLAFLRVQVDAGVSAVQLFDSWAGALSEADYRRYVLPHSAAVLAGLADAGVPRIHFGVGTGELLAAMGEAGADVVGVDWRTPLDVATGRLGPDKAVQGNLDPACCSRRGRWSRPRCAGCWPGPGRPGARLQPRSRRAAGDRPGRADPGGRPGARAVQRAEPTRADRAMRQPWRVAVVGGGIAGLAAAVRLRELAPAGTEIIVYEQSGALGGKLRTGELAGAAGRARRRVVPDARAGGAESAAVALARRLGLGERWCTRPRAGRARRRRRAAPDPRRHADGRTR